ncbi:hypothetical protein RhiTH_011574 [Rhizoctonia solani]
MCFKKAKIWDEDTFKKMLSIHSGTLQQMILSGNICYYPKSSSADPVPDSNSDSGLGSDTSMNNSTSSNSSSSNYLLEWRRLELWDDLAEWLKDRIPGFQLKDDQKHPLVFQD